MRERVRQVLQSNTSYWIVLVFFSISVVVIYFSIPPLSNEEYRECEEVARDIVYNQKNSLIIEVPEEFTVEIKDNTIIKVKLKNKITTGFVEAHLRNGELMYDRVDNVYGKVVLSVVAGVLVTLICYLALVRYASS